jgi:hypothetical protein
MSLIIVRIKEKADGVKRTMLPQRYGDGQQAIQGMKKVLSGYKNSGRNDEHGYWWARDDQGEEFKFVISGG